MRFLVLLALLATPARAEVPAEVPPGAEALLSGISCQDGLELADEIAWARSSPSPVNQAAYAFVLDLGLTLFPGASSPEEAYGRAFGDILWECRGTQGLSLMDAARQAVQFHAENPG